VTIRAFCLCAAMIFRVFDGSIISEVGLELVTPGTEILRIAATAGVIMTLVGHDDGRGSLAIVPTKFVLALDCVAHNGRGKVWVTGVVELVEP